MTLTALLKMTLPKKLRELRYYLSSLGRRVDYMWSDTLEPRLVCSMRVKHSISCEREEVDLIISNSAVTLSHSTSDPGRTSKPKITVQSIDFASGLIEQFNGMRILEIGSVSESLFDGSVSLIAARDRDGVNIFREYSMKTPQAEIRDMLLEMAYSSLADAESGRRESLAPASHTTGHTDP